MNIQEVIAKKRDNQKLDKQEIEYFVSEYTNRYNYRLSSSSFNYGNLYKWNE